MQPKHAVSIRSTKDNIPKQQPQTPARIQCTEGIIPLTSFDHFPVAGHSFYPLSLIASKSKAFGKRMLFSL